MNQIPQRETIVEVRIVKTLSNGTPIIEYHWQGAKYGILPEEYIEINPSSGRRFRIMPKPTPPEAAVSLAACETMRGTP